MWTWSLEYKLIFQILEILSPGHYNVTVWQCMGYWTEAAEIKTKQLVEGECLKYLDVGGSEVQTLTFGFLNQMFKGWTGRVLHCIVLFSLPSLRRHRRCLSLPRKTTNRWLVRERTSGEYIWIERMHLSQMKIFQNIYLFNRTL